MYSLSRYQPLILVTSHATGRTKTHFFLLDDMKNYRMAIQSLKLGHVGPIVMFTRVSFLCANRLEIPTHLVYTLTMESGSKIHHHQCATLESSPPLPVTQGEENVQINELIVASGSTNTGRATSFSLAAKGGNSRTARTGFCNKVSLFLYSDLILIHSRPCVGILQHFL